MSDYHDTATCPKCHGESRNLETCDLCGALIERIRAREMEAAAAQNEGYQSGSWEVEHYPQEPSLTKKLVITLILVGVGLLLFFNFRGRASHDDVYVKSVFTSDFVAEVDNYSTTPVLVDFYADWCGPCKMMAPHLDTFAGEYSTKVKVVKVNVDNNPELAQRFGVRGIPMLVVMKNGREAHRVTGGMGLDQLKSEIVPHL